VKRTVWSIVFGSILTLVIAVPVLAIVNGELDTDDEFPFVCAIVIDKVPDNIPNLPTPQTTSSGTLIHPRVVMTAGHTVEFLRSVIRNNDNIELSDFFVDFTPDARPNAQDASPVKYRITDMYLHDDFSGRDATSIDVGLLVLADEVEGVTPLQLPDAGFLDDLDLDRGTTESKPKFLVGGYGNTEAAPADGSLPDGQRRIAVSSFKSLRTNYLMLSQNAALGEGGFSRGDSGGAAMWDLGDGTLVQVGILVNGDHASADYGACLRTDVKTVIDFIDEVIAEVER